MGKLEQPNTAPIENNDSNKEKQAERSTSLELSDLEKRAVMDKMCDIASPGIAYTGIRNHSTVDDIVTRIFKNGLLGSVNKGEGDVLGGINSEARPASAEKWAKDLRTNKNSLVFFNISGRTSFVQELGVDDSEIIDPEMKHMRMEIVILFDLKKFKERHGESTVKNTHNQRINTFMSTWGQVSPGGKVDARFGFTLSYRVAPRFFKGVVITERLFKSLSFNERRVLFEKWLDEEYTVDYKINFQGSNYKFYNPSFYRSIRYVADEFIGVITDKVVEGKKQGKYNHYNSNDQAELELFAFQKIRDLINNIQQEEYKYDNHGSDIYHDTEYDCDNIHKRVFGGHVLHEFVKRVIYDFTGPLKVLETDPTQKELFLKKRLIETLQEMFVGVGDKKDRLVPIYDKDGNMLWPEQMSHEDIVEMKARETDREMPKS